MLHAYGRAIVAAVGLVLAAGCGTAAAPPSPTAAPVQNPLYDAARKEAELNFYTTLNTQNGQPVVEKFMARYPGVKVNYNRQTSEKLEEVMNQEARAGKMTWDVVETNEDVMVRFIASGYVQPYTSPVAARYPDNLRDPKGLWVTDRVNAQSPSRTLPIGPPASASGPTWPMQAPVETPEKRASVRTATCLPKLR